MANHKKIYTEIFNVYKLTNLYESKRNTIRKKIKRLIKKEFDTNESDVDKIWGNLNDFQKDKFMYYTIKDKLLDAVPERHKKNVINNIESKIDDYFIKSKIKVGERNQRMERLRDIPIFTKENYEKLDEMGKFVHSNIKIREYITDSEKEQCYSQLCDDLIAEGMPREELPTKTEYFKNPWRGYNYLKGYQSSNDNNDIYVTQEEINSVILKTIMKIISEVHKKVIDIESIEKCLKYKKEFEEDYRIVLENYETLDIEDDRVLKYEAYLKKLKNLDFY